MTPIIFRKRCESYLTSLAKLLRIRAMNQRVHAGIESTLTRQSELVTVFAQKQHQETRTTIADESQTAKKTHLHTLTDLASVQDQPLSIKIQTICAQTDSAHESLISQLNIVGGRALREMKQQFMEQRRRVEKAWEPYHRQSQALKVNCGKEKHPHGRPNTSDSRSQSELNYQISLVVLGNL